MRILRKRLSVLCCIVLDVMIPWPNILKRKWVFVKNEKRGFWDILGSEAPLCESSHSVILRNGLCDSVGLRAMGIISFILRLCANVFGVGPESDGEALTDHWSRPWG